VLRRIALVGSSGVIGAIALALVQIRVGALFGAGNELDAFFVGAAIPSVLLAVGAGSIVALVVPRLPADDELGASRQTGRIAVLGFLFTLPLAALIAALAPLFTTLVGPGLDEAAADSAAEVLRVYAISIPFTSAAHVFAAHGHAVGRGWAGGASTALYGLVWFGLLFIPTFTDSAATVAAAGLIATGVQVLSAFVFSSAGEHRPRPRFTSINVGRQALRLLGIVLVASVIGRLGFLLDPIYGSLLEVGAVSQLSYATRIALLAVFVSGQGAALSVLAVGRERDKRADADVSFGLLTTLLLALGVGAVMVVAGPAGAELLLARGEFTTAAAAEIGHLLQLWAPAVVVIAVIWGLESIFYSGERSPVVLRAALVGFSVNAAASGAFVALLGIWGRPLGVLVAMFAQLAVCLHYLPGDPRLASLKSLVTLRWGVAITFASGAAALAGLLLGEALLTSGVGAVLAALAGGAVTVALLVRFERRPAHPA
jgi:putative peptidoglycan lipid II flippase